MSPTDAVQVKPSGLQLTLLRFQNLDFPSQKTRLPRQGAPALAALGIGLGRLGDRQGSFDKPLQVLARVDDIVDLTFPTIHRNFDERSKEPRCRPPGFNDAGKCMLRTMPVLSEAIEPHFAEP